jgi:hypothetical protein
LIDVVGVLFEQLQQGFGRNRVQFLPVARHAEAHDDLFTLVVELVARVINRARLTLRRGTLFHGHLRFLSISLRNAR